MYVSFAGFVILTILGSIHNSAGTMVLLFCFIISRRC